MTISTKKEMYLLQRRGLLGNCLMTYGWREFLENGVEGNFGFRHRTMSGSPLFKRGFDRRGVIGYVRGLLAAKKIVEGDVAISEDTSGVDSMRLLQGELYRSCESPGLTFAYSGRLASETGMTCREELRVPNVVEVRGLRAKFLLEKYFDERSYDYLQELMTDYPDDVLEFTALSCPVGCFKWRVIMWELRGY
jgi:hypothetical protein